MDRIQLDPNVMRNIYAKDGGVGLVVNTRKVHRKLSKGQQKQQQQQNKLNK